jgi:hypothetical protein
MDRTNSRALAIEAGEHRFCIRECREPCRFDCFGGSETLAKVVAQGDQAGA